jgi:hypothetical protein
MVERQMATNRQDHTKGASGDTGRRDKKGTGGDMPSAPEVVSFTVEPSPSLASTPKSAQGDIWTTLLESSPWSASQGGRIESAPMVSAPARSLESPPAGDLVNRWSQPIWRTPTRREDGEEAVETVIVEGTDPSPMAFKDDAVLSVPQAVIEVQPDPVVDIEEPVIEVEAPAALAKEPAADVEVSAPDVEVLASEVEESDDQVEEPAVGENAATSLARLVEIAEGIIYPDTNPTDGRLADVLIEVPEDFTVVGADDAPEADVDEAASVAIDVGGEVIAKPMVEFEVTAEEPMEAVKSGVLPVDAVVEPEETFGSAEIEAPQVEIVRAVDEDATPAPAVPLQVPEPVASGSNLADLIEEAAIATPAAAPDSPAPAPAAKSERMIRKVAASARKGSVIQEVPVEDLLGGIFGVAGSAVRGVFNAGAGLVDGVVKGGRFIGSNVVAGTRRLAGTIEGSCGSCSTPECDTKDAKSNRQS